MNGIVVTALVSMGFIAVLGVFSALEIENKRRTMQAERRRLERIVHDYNARFKDDYNPFE